MPPLHAIIIEDNQDGRRAVAQLVKAEGYSVVAYGTLKEASAAWEAKTPDLAVVDLELPDGSGMQAVEMLQSLGAEVVVLTGHGSVDTAVEAMRLGVVDFLTKPLEISR